MYFNVRWPIPYQSQGPRPAQNPRICIVPSALVRPFLFQQQTTHVTPLNSLIQTTVIQSNKQQRIQQQKKVLWSSGTILPSGNTLLLKMTKWERSRVQSVSLNPHFKDQFR